MGTRRNNFSHTARQTASPYVQLCLRSRKSHRFRPREKKTRINETICNHITCSWWQVACGIFFCFKRLWIRALEPAVWGVLLRASGNVLSARAGTENMWDPPSDQSSRHSRSCQGRQNAHCYIWLAGCCLLLLPKLNPSLTSLLSLSFHYFLCAFFTLQPSLTSLILFLSFFHSFILSFFLSFITSCSLNLESEIRGREKVIQKQDVGASSVWVFTDSGTWINTETAFAFARNNKARGCLT